MLIIFEVQIELPIIRLGSLLERLEQVLDAVRGERRLAKDTHDLEHWPANLEVVLDDGNEAVGDDGDVNLYSDCIFRFSPAMALFIMVSISIVFVKDALDEFCKREYTLFHHQYAFVRWTTYIILTIMILTCGVFDASQFIYVNF